MTDSVDASALEAYMSASVNGDFTEKQQRGYILNRYRTVRDLFMYRKIQQEEYESYTDHAYREQQLNKLQKEFRDNYVERLTVVEEMKKLGELVNDPLVPDQRGKTADKVEEAEVVAYMSREAPPTELATEQDRKDYFRKRIADVEDVYRYLKLQQEEVEKYQDKAYREATMGRLKAQYRHNYVERVAVVTALRRLGIPVEDRFVPLSKV